MCLYNETKSVLVFGLGLFVKMTSTHIFRLVHEEVWLHHEVEY